MNFLDSLLDKVPIIRDMPKKRRILFAGFIVFAVISILGMLIDAIVGSGGIITTIAFIIGFVLVAVIMLADYFMARSANKEPPNDSPYDFFDESMSDTPYQNDEYGYQIPDNPSDDNYDIDIGYNNEEYNNSENFDYNDQNSPEMPNTENIPYEMPSQDIEYTNISEPQQEQSAPIRFGGMFRRGQTNENTAISDEINGASNNNSDGFNNGRYSNEYETTRSSFEFTNEGSAPMEEMPIRADEHVQLPYQNNRAFEENRRNFGYQSSSDFNNNNSSIGEPVMTFPSASQPVQEEVSRAADFVAPNISAPIVNDIVGGPVMSIPFRAQNQPSVTEYAPSVQSYAAPAQSYNPPVQTYSAPAQTSPYVPTAPQVPAYQQGTRGQEIEEFFDHMSDDELLYSDCVEVWASDAKPAAIRLLKQIESLSDKKKADTLGREAEYVNAMIDRIYYFTMLDSIKDNLELKKYNFSVMVKECLRRFSPFFMEKRIGLLWKGLDIDIITDKRWLIFALTQVVFNAVEFTGLGGKIAISAKKEGSLIHLMVDDSGCGISSDDLPHIFMAGFMGDNVPNESGRRTGMGLFITRSVIEKLGGTVTADSATNKGTRITIILPEKP